MQTRGNATMLDLPLGGQALGHHLRYPVGALDTVESLSLGIASSQEQTKRKEEAEEGRKAAEEAEQAVPAVRGLCIAAAPLQGLFLPMLPPTDDFYYLCYHRRRVASIALQHLSMDVN